MKIKDLISLLKQLNPEADMRVLTEDEFRDTLIVSGLEIVEYQDGSYLLSGNKE